MQHVRFTPNLQMVFFSIFNNEANARFNTQMPINLSWPKTIRMPKPFPPTPLSVWSKIFRWTPAFASTTLTLPQRAYLSIKSLSQFHIG